ncbi:MAG: HYR domain-containing protein, partial [Mariprofundaceae bacterium]|nr:HYR domain-containing protein [Mariprofundaceae bacterium]
TSTGTQTVTVADTTAPALTVPADVSVEANGVLSTVDIGVATATDIFEPVTLTNNAPASFPVGTTVVTYTSTDANGLTITGTQNVTVVDTTSPTVTAQLVPVNTGHHDDGDDEHHGKHEKHARKGLFKVVFTATDIADLNLTLVATLNGETVANGQIIELKHSKKSRSEYEHGKLEIKGLSFSLNVSATDASANVGTAAAVYAFPVKHKKHEAKKGERKKSEGKSKKDKKHDKDD